MDESKRRTPRTLKVKEVAEELDISEKAVYQLVASGKLRTLNLGARKGYRVLRTDLENFLNSREIEVTHRRALASQFDPLRELEGANELDPAGADGRTPSGRIFVRTIPRRRAHRPNGQFCAWNARGNRGQ